MDQDEPKKHAGDKPKPTPIREAVGEAEPRRAGRSDRLEAGHASQAPGLRGQRERPGGSRARASVGSKGGGRRPRPDRGSSSSGGGARQRQALQPTPAEDLPSREFEHDGCEWIVRLCGRTSVGSAIGRGAPLMHLTFYKAAEPLVEFGNVLVTGKSLAELPDLQLPELLANVGSGGWSNESSG